MQEDNTNQTGDMGGCGCNCEACMKGDHMHCTNPGMCHYQKKDQGMGGEDETEGENEDQGQ